MNTYSKQIAVILTCFNRKEKTLWCINRIFNQKSYCGYDIKVFLCDDGSTDGTSQTIRVLYPSVNIIQGSGNLYWAKGMSAALEEAKKCNPDFYLMVNDDVDFFDDMLYVMIQSYKDLSDVMCAIVGSTKDKNTGDFTYGGYWWNGKAINEKTTKVLPRNPCKECNQTNWNCFLLPQKLYSIIGKIDSYYQHSFADFDYSNRITKNGYEIYVANNYIGYCSRNQQSGTWSDKNLRVIDRLKALHKKTGLPPKSNWHYCKKYYGLYAPYLFIRPYLSIIKDGISGKLFHSDNVNRC